MPGDGVDEALAAAGLVEARDGDAAQIPRLHLDQAGGDDAAEGIAALLHAVGCADRAVHDACEWSVGVCRRDRQCLPPGIEPLPELARGRSRPARRSWVGGLSGLAVLMQPGHAQDVARPLPPCGRRDGSRAASLGAAGGVGALVFDAHDKAFVFMAGPLVAASTTT
jgi:hypothetical protein